MKDAEIIKEFRETRINEINKYLETNKNPILEEWLSHYAIILNTAVNSVLEFEELKEKHSDLAESLSLRCDLS